MKTSYALNDKGVFRLAKREDMPRKKAWMIRVLAVVFALIVCALVIVVITKQNPLQVYVGLVDGAVGNVRRTWQTIRETMILLIVAVGLTPAFKMRFWNIGAEGQILVGGCACAAVMIYCSDKMAGWLLMIVMVIVSCGAGMIWGLIPAFFKARLNTNETLFTLMLNYVATQIVTFCIVYWENPVGSNTVGIINSATKKGWLPQIGTSQAYVLIVVIVLALTAFMSIYMSKSKQGYEIAVVGASQNTARYAGISVRKVILRTMAISGAICGLAGFLMVSGSSHTISTETAGGRGFTAIIIAWMAHFNAVSMIIVSLLIAFLQQGAIQIASQFGLNDNASDVITGILLFFLIGSEFFIQYKIEFHSAKKEVK